MKTSRRRTALDIPDTASMAMREYFGQHRILRRTKWLLPFAGVMLACMGILGAEGPTEAYVTRATLKNGLRVIIVRSPLAPVVSTMVNYRAGSDECPSGFPGSAHALEHMMFRGNPGLSAEQLANITAALGGEFNADTQQAVTQYFLTVPAEDLNVALRIEAARMRGVLATEPLWDKERGAIEQEVAQDLSNPEYVFYMKLLEAYFKGTPYEHDALGTRPSFDKTTGAALREFYHSWYAPNNAVLIVVGEVQPAQALEQIKKLFADLPSRTIPARPEFHFQTVQPETLHLETDQPHGIAAITFRFPGSDNTDYAAAQVLADVLSSQRGQLYALVPAGKALSASFDYQSLPKAGIAYANAAFPAGADAEKLLEQMRAVLAAETTNGVLGDLVEAAKRREITAAELQKNSVLGLAMVWSQAVAVEGRQSPQDDIDAIRRVSVSDVNRVAREYLNFDHAVSAILTPQASAKAASSTSFGGKESLAPSKIGIVKLPDWADKAVNRIAVPASTSSPVVTTFTNGLKLIVQPESISGTVCVYGRIKNNPKVQMPPHEDGVDRALAELFSYGSKSLDRLAFQRALDEIGALESAGTDFSLQVMAEHFDRGAQLLADNLLTPALPEKDFETIQRQLAAAVAGELHSPNYLTARAILAGLFPARDPVRRHATPASVKALSFQQVRDYYRDAFRPDLTTIVVIGKVTADQARDVIMKYFGHWSAEGPKPLTRFPPAPTNAPSVTVVPDASRVQDKVTLAETLALTRTNTDYYALELGNHVLGGGFYATRLYHDLREMSGLVYHVASTFEIGESRGIYEVNYACDPPNVAKARAIVVGNLNDLRQNEVTPRELRQAKALLLREIPLAESSVERVANRWLSDSTLGLPLDEPILAAHRYVQLNGGEVRAAFAKWLRPDDLVQVTQGPTPE